MSAGGRPIGCGFVLDPSYRRPADGTVLLAGSPLRMFTLGERGRAVVEAIEADRPLPPGHEPLTRRLLDAGAIHPRLPDRTEHDPPAGDAPGQADLTVVMPAHGSLPRFRSDRLRTIVVDDASDPPLARPHGVEVLRLEHNVGPGGARDAGLAQVVTPYVAFVDHDVDVDEHDLVRLLDLFDDPRVALAAPRIVAPAPRVDASASGASSASVTQRYELGRSPLDLGPTPARIAPGSRVAYVPAAVLVCRVEALRSIGGFDAALRFGEDVDLEWRLVAAGWSCRYEPSITATHDVRPSWSTWWRQRFGYGSSAASLAERHPGALAPVRVSGWSVAAWAAVAAGHPFTGIGLGVGTTLALVRKLRAVPATEALRLAGLGNLFAGRQIAAALIRAWWPLTALAALVSRRARRVLVAAIAATAIWDAREHRGQLGAPAAVAIRLADDLAYGSGLWAGMWRRRTIAPIVPDLTSWPGRGRRRGDARRRGSPTGGGRRET